MRMFARIDADLGGFLVVYLQLNPWARLLRIQGRIESRQSRMSYHSLSPSQHLHEAVIPWHHAQFTAQQGPVDPHTAFTKSN